MPWTIGMVPPTMAANATEVGDFNVSGHGILDLSSDGAFTNPVHGTWIPAEDIPNIFRTFSYPVMDLDSLNFTGDSEWISVGNYTPSRLTHSGDCALFPDFGNSTSQNGDIGTSGDSSGAGVAQSAQIIAKRVLKQPTSMIVILTVAYVLVFLLGVVNNSLIVNVIYRNPTLQTVTNYFIANLAVADILVSIVVLPITLLSNVFFEWWYGLFLCKAIPYLQGVAVGASVNTLAAVAIERYLAIFFPQTSKLSPTASVVMIVFIWIVPMCIFIPWVIVYTVRKFKLSGFNYIICLPDWNSIDNQKMYNLGAVFLTCYLIPLVFIAIFYLLIGIRVCKRRVRGIRGTRTERNINRSKIKIVRMLMTVFVIFVVSWLPLYAIRIRVLFGPPMSHTEKDLLNIYLTPLAQWLGGSNSCVNPFIYCYFSTNFRRSIIQVLRSRSCCGKITTT